MAEVTIGQLAPLTPLEPTDVLEAQRGDDSGFGKVTIQQIVDEALDQTPATVWGQITGILSSQTDLQSALDAKLSVAGGTLTGALTVQGALTCTGFTSTGIDDNATSTAVTIDSAGRLLVGGQSSAIDSGFYSTVSIGGSTATGTSGYLEFRRRSDGAQGAAIYINAGQNAELFYNVANSTGQAAHVFLIDAVEAMRIDSSQQLLVGTTLFPSVAGREGFGVTSTGTIYTARNTASAANHQIFVNTNGIVSTIGSSGSGMVWGADLAAGYHAFKTSGTEAMRIDSSQQVGIGTTSPGNNLDVQRSTDGFAFRVRQSTSGDQIEIGQFNPYSYIRATGAPLYLQTVDANELLLGTNNTEAIRIDISQNVGVGNANPFYKFDVLGSGAVSMRTRSIDSEAEVRIEAAPGKNSRLTLGDNSGPASVQITGNSNRMLFFTATTEAMRIDSGRNILFGCTSLPAAASQYGWGFDASVGKMLSCRFGTSAASHHDFLNDNGAVGSIITSGSGMLWTADLTAGYHSFTINNLEALRIDAAQNTTIRGDLIVDSLAGTGTRDVQVLPDGTLIAV